ncbi:Oidioi.mRNA.OKI2018_I69.PAR.g9935.t1.cds [Oikopleura dioica]|uniref:Oidioi.mRNA.OKI2018_I69.PAR.g9935.t1.cds n=1 Tax=Oikopleura dioica TaxID=34765 RepID=A0ABN7RS39_OIKDI|nr:Oidioi.mRNA.OKI2018_I69.PAR.g9935.t1.cds [Oikopleura dioica]
MRLLLFLVAACNFEIVHCQIYKGMRAADYAKMTKGPSQFGKLRTRGKTLPPPVEETMIFGAWLQGNMKSTKWLHLFQHHEIKLWHNFEYKETNSEKLEIVFHNYYKKPLVTMDITKYSQEKLIKLLKHQGFYRRRYQFEKMNEDQAEAPFIKYKWEPGKMELR